MISLVTFQNVHDWTTVVANCVTILLGVSALVALLLKRKEIGRLLSLVTNLHLRDRVNRIKETLGRLEGMNYNNKEERPEIVALVGQLQGQLKGLDSSEGSLVAILEDIEGYSNPGNRLNEARKRALVFAVHGNLDNILHNGAKTLITK